MEKNKEIKKSRKVTGIVLASVLFAATAVGAGFGFSKAVNELGGVDTNYNDFVQIEADVDFNNGGDINDAARTVTNTLEFLGMQNAVVRTMGDSKIIINNPISSYSDGELRPLNTNDDHFKLMNATNNTNYLNEVGSLMIPLFFDGTLDIRDTEGDAAFILDDYGWTFAGGVDEGGTFGVSSDTGTETETESATTYSTDFDMGDYDITNFFDGAKLTHSQGNPVIELQISKKGSDSDEYINMFKDLDRYIDSTAGSSNPTQYVVWFNYELTYDLVNMLDPDGLGASASLYEYVSGNETLRPLYVTTGTESIMSSKYSDTVELTGNFSEQQAQYFVDKINNSNDFTYSNVSFEVILNLQTKIMLLVLALLLLIMVITIIFSFVAYFGLLGLIASAVFTLSIMTMGLIISATGILVTGLGLISLGMIVVATALLVFTAMNEYKNNNEDKYLSVSKVFTSKVSSIQSMIFAPLVTTVLLFYGAGLVSSTLITIPLYLVVIGMVLAYVFVSILLLPLIYFMDLTLEWSRVEQTSRWDLISGINKLDLDALNKKGLEADESKSKLGIIVSLVLLALAVIVGGTLYGTTGSVVNANVFGTQNYSYVVQATEDVAWLDLEDDSSLSGIHPYGVDMSQDYFENTEKYMNEVESAFESNGVKVSDIDVIRVDEVADNSGDLQLIGSFGFEIDSNDKITSSNIDAINEDLAAIDADLNDEAIDIAHTSYEVTERMSWNGEESIKMVGYTQNNNLIKGVYSLLIMALITTLILLIVGNWGVAIAALVTTLMESALIISPFIILYLPFSTLVVFPVLLLAGLSFRTKVVIAKQAKSDEIETNKWDRAAKKNQWTLPIFASILLVLELFLFGTYSAMLVIPMIIATVVAPIAIYLVQQLVFPILASKLDSVRNSGVKKKLAKDIEEAKNSNDGELREEYIEGVNM